jgi:choline dehydrogenase
LAGHKTLLLEAGDDQGENYNYTIPAYSARTALARPDVATSRPKI